MVRASASTGGGDGGDGIGGDGAVAGAVHQAFSCGQASILSTSGVLARRFRFNTRFRLLMAKKASMATRMIETEHATPIAMPRLMPGSGDSVS
jgi:hypothetical protein